MISDKKHVQAFIAYLKHHKIRQVVLSPGSRNAPLSLSFSEDDFFELFVIADERAAAFFALGLVLKHNHPVVVCCTSGSAPLNYAPAVAEAYYQKLPLLVATADRPARFINQNDGQAMNQHGIFANFSKYFGNLSESAQQRSALNERYIAEAITHLQQAPKGPVHLNFEFSEPLYQKEAENGFVKPIKIVGSSESFELSDELVREFQTAKKVWFMIGQHHPEDEALRSIAELRKRYEHWLFVAESTSNLPFTADIPCIDRFIDTLDPSQIGEVVPELMITTSGAVVSKKVKAFFLKNKPDTHWHIGAEHGIVDMFEAVSAALNADESLVLKAISQLPHQIGDDEYRSKLLKIEWAKKAAHQDFIAQMPFCDFSVFAALHQQLNFACTVHLANSTPVRYFQLFEWNANVKSLANRGVSGIDGSMSTASGYAFHDDELNLMITGDLSFFYDSNALWSAYLRPNFRILLINNGGGDIFSIIPGPETVSGYEQSFKANHSWNAAHLAQGFGIDYHVVNSGGESLTGALNWLLNKQATTPLLLEVNTQNQPNASTLKAYFAELKLKTVP